MEWQIGWVGKAVRILIQWLIVNCYIVNVVMSPSPQFNQPWLDSSSVAKQTFLNTCQNGDARTTVIWNRRQFLSGGLLSYFPVFARLSVNWFILNIFNY